MSDEEDIAEKDEPDDNDKCEPDDNYWLTFCQLCKKIAEVSGSNQKTEIIKNFFDKGISGGEISFSILFRLSALSARQSAF